MPLFKKEVGYKAEYLGGHGAFPKKMACHIVILPDHVEIPEMPLSIPYSKIDSVQSMSQEKVTAMRFLLVGLLSLAWKKKRLFMVLSYKDGQMKNDMIFDVDKIEEVQPAIYRNMIAAKGRA